VNSDTVVIDSSVCVAIFKGEAETSSLIERTFAYKRRIMSAATWLESAIVCESAVKEGGGAHFERLLAVLGVEVVPVTAEQVRIALEGFKRFGKGRGAPASLNYGDCFVYALAKELGVPVLFKGNDFAQTDIEPG
jgi:ribonuclease VapC